MNLNLDIHTSVQTAFILTLVLALLCLLVGVRSIQAGSKLQYFRKRHDRIVHGWRMVFIACIFGFSSYLVSNYAEPLAYRAFPPSPTVTSTPTITVTPSISPTPTITLTPTITNTPSVTNTPFLPEEIERLFESTITPAADPVFSPLVFARDLDDNFTPIDPETEFANPIDGIYGVFSYDQMTPGAQWTALWFRDGELVHYESIPWNGGTGGYGYTEWRPPSESWLPGVYEVQIFVGTQRIESAASTFTVTGNPPTSTPSPPPTRTNTPTATIGPSPTRTSTPTPTVTLTPTITRTPTITLTRRPTDTRWPTATNTNTPAARP